MASILVVEDNAVTRKLVLSAELAILSGISKALSRRVDLERSLDEVLAALLDAGGISTGALLLFEERRTLVRSVGTGEIWSDAMLASFPDEPRDEERADAISFLLSNLIFREVLERRT